MTTAELGESYCMIGRYHEPTVRMEVEVIEEPDLSVIREAIDCIKKQGINVSSLIVVVYSVTCCVDL